MRLHRYLLVQFTGKPHKTTGNPSSSSGFSAEVEGVKVTLHPADHGTTLKGWQMVQASVDLIDLPVLNDNRLVIPDEPRRQCERIAEHAINILSVLDLRGKSICSPLNSVALEAASQDEREFLGRSRGILAKNTHESAVGSPLSWTPEIGKGLADRLDGVALLSEALSAGNEGARYRELIRFLELAFSLPANDQRLVRALARYFDHAPGYGYEAGEFKEWQRLRHPSSHADLRRTKWVALTSDVRHVVLRMQQACLDILLNKVAWRSNSSERRNLWQPDAMTTSKNGHMVVKQNTRLTTLFRVFDEFGVYPRILDIVVDHSKDGFYAQFVQGD
jgi:hypothetical protein